MGERTTKFMFLGETIAQLKGTYRTNHKNKYKVRSFKCGTRALQGALFNNNFDFEIVNFQF